MSNLLGRLGGIIESLSGKRPASMVTKSKVEQSRYVKVIDENGHESYKLRERIVKETTETVFVSGDMRLTGWQTTYTYDPSNGKVVSELKERLDKQ